MSGNVRTTYPTWHQPWACLGCEKAGEVIVRVTNMKAEWLRQMTRDVEQHHRAQSPMCPHDISTAYATNNPKRATSELYGYRGPMVLSRPYRQGKSGAVIWAQGPEETDDAFAKSVRERVWPPWRSGN